MGEYLSNYQIRHPVVQDAQAVFELIITSDIAEYGEPDMDLEDLQGDWENIDLNKDAWIVYDQTNKLVGYAATYHRWGRFQFDFYTHPEYNADQLRRGLLTLCDLRSQQIMQFKQIHNATAISYNAHTNQDVAQFLDEIGFKPAKYHFQMQIKLQNQPPFPSWPSGTSLRNFSPGQDERLTYDFIQKAFERPDRIPPTFEDWLAFMTRPGLFDPKLWFLLFHQKTLIGAALCINYEESGWIRQLAVDEDWRRQGIGAALLQQAFAIFYQYGHSKVGLAVAAENQRAYSFYQDVGMHILRQYDEYHKELSHPNPIPL
jgi:GNAT superfamily N-acetyltransferase